MDDNAKTVVVLGASPKPERYANRAMRLLREHGHRAIPVNPALREIEDQECFRSIRDVPGKIDTVTVYLRESRSDPLIDDIMAAKPRRIILNPGAENDSLTKTAQKNGIEVVEGCTLVMLRAGTF